MASSPHTPLPCVVHLGFAGNRSILLPGDGDEAALRKELLEQLTERLRQLRTDFKLEPTHFFCGVSQIAIGADALFAKACEQLGIPQCIVLPQRLDDYLSASSADGRADFPAKELEQTRDLLAGSQIIQVQAVANSAERHKQFQEVNFAIAQRCDAVVCLHRAEKVDENLPGGTIELLDQGKARKIPALELKVSVSDGRLKLTETWHNFGPSQPLRLPHTPHEMAAIVLPASEMLPTVTEFLKALKTFGSEQAGWQKRIFRFAALIIVLAHVLATMCATAMLVEHSIQRPPPIPHDGDVTIVAVASAHAEAWLIWLLAAELLLLALGAFVHLLTHRTEIARVWAFARLMAEVARSVGAVASRHRHLSYLLRLPFPISFQPILRTLCILHLRSTRPTEGGWEKWLQTSDKNWKADRDRYVSDRLAKQLEFYSTGFRKRRFFLRLASVLFWMFALSAMAAVGFKLMAYGGLFGQHVQINERVFAILGAATIVFPVFAVGVLSLSAAMDYYAQAHTYSEMIPYLRERVQLLEAANVPQEFDALAYETESRLLGETLNWFFRRSFTHPT